MVILMLLSTTFERASKEIKQLLLLLSTSKYNTESVETTKGLTFKLCGLIGEITKISEVGITKGPPTLKL